MQLSKPSSGMPPASAPLIELKQASKKFTKRVGALERLGKRMRGSIATDQVVNAVDSVDIAIARGEVVGLVGESGCGKSTLGRMVAGLHGMSSGSRFWKGQPIDLFSVSQRRTQQLAMQMIFQDPFASLNPRMTVREIVGEAVGVHGIVSPDERDAHVRSVLARVQLDASALQRYPHQFSGGQRARVGIARALAVRPEMLICDESVAALDVSIQAQILNLFMDLRQDLQLTYLFISHDLGVVQHISDRVVVMYLGRVVESGRTEQIFNNATHPYTVALLRESPTLEARKKKFVPISGEIPSPLSPPSGCHFHPRCPKAIDRCKVDRPMVTQIAEGHSSACHLAMA